MGIVLHDHEIVGSTATRPGLWGLQVDVLHLCMSLGTRGAARRRRESQLIFWGRETPGEKIALDLPFDRFRLGIGGIPSLKQPPISGETAGPVPRHVHDALRLLASSVDASGGLWWLVLRLSGAPGCAVAQPTRHP